MNVSAYGGAIGFVAVGAMVAVATIEHLWSRLGRRSPVYRRERHALSAGGMDVFSAALFPGKAVDLEQQRVREMTRDDVDDGAPPYGRIDLASDPRIDRSGGARVLRPRACRLLTGGRAGGTGVAWLRAAEAPGAQLAGEGDGVLLNRFDKAYFDGLSGEAFLRVLDTHPHH